MPSATRPSCVECHDSVREAIQKEVLHGAVELGCEACHIDHRNDSLGSNSPYTPAAANHLIADKPALCWGCHEQDDPSLAAAHHNLPFETSNCTRCHDPHGSSAAKLLPEFQHGPFSARQCESCHQPQEPGTLGIAAKTAYELCFGCHTEMQSRIAGAKFAHTLVVSEPNSCTDCHDPHGTSRAQFLRASVRQLCERCHSQILDHKRFLHEPAEANCAICHDPHSTDFAKHLRAEGNDLCLECHGRNGMRVSLGTGPVLLFGGAVKLPQRPFGDLKWFRLSADQTRGHPLAGHPVFAEPKGDQPAVRCTSCHVPHSSNSSRKLYVGELSNKSEVCVQCH